MSTTLNSPTIILGIGGGIAAYKLCELASRLTQDGAVVQTVLTQNAEQFVTPLTFAALTGQPVHASLWPKDFSSTSGVAASMAHIDLARQADVVLIAPATADLISKLAHGAADDLLTTIALATTAPVLIAPSMNPTMLAHPATQRNLEILRELGYTIINPETGRTACREEGSGRLPETKVLLGALENALAQDYRPSREGGNPDASTSLSMTSSQNVDSRLRGNDDVCGENDVLRDRNDNVCDGNDNVSAKVLLDRTVLITAGSTREALDPVRFLGNRSSGKMGYALAEAAAELGAKVLLVSGPVQLAPPENVQLFPVVSTEEMYEAVLSQAAQCDIIIGAAAPADFRPTAVAERKLKKQGNAAFHLELEPTPDIIASVAANKTATQIVIGFAAETNDGLENAQQKLAIKNLDAIVLNDVTQRGSGFEVDTNQVTWITENQQEQWPMMSKRNVAERILEKGIKLLQTK